MKIFELVEAVAYLGVCYAIVALSLHYIRSQRVRKRVLDLPILNLQDGDFTGAEKAYFGNLRDILRDGYRKYKHDFYQLYTPTGYLVIASADYVQELSRLPEGTLDFHAASQKRMVGDYTWLQIADELLAQTLRSNLARQLDCLIPVIREEVEYCIQAELHGNQDEGATLSFQQLAPRLIAIVIGRVIVGPGLNREEEWVKSVTQFVADVYVGGLKLKKFSHFMRPFAARFLVPEIRRTWRHQAMARRRLVPLLQSRLENQASPNGKKTPDLLQWLVENNLKQSRPRTLEQLAELALVAFVGSTNTTATTLTNVLLDIAVRPEDLDVLREEISCAELSATKTPRQSLSVYHRSKLDSYIKESQRLNPAHLMTFSRIVRKSFTLTNGLRLPAGTHLIIPASMVSLDGDIYESSECFRGFRFSEMRAQRPEDATKCQLTTTSTQALHFGYGRNACPGRFLASTVLKIFVSSILANFDLGITSERPKSSALGSRNSPPTNVEIQFTKRNIESRLP